MNGIATLRSWWFGREPRSNPNSFFKSGYGATRSLVRKFSDD